MAEALLPIGSVTIIMIIIMYKGDYFQINMRVEKFRLPGAASRSLRRVSGYLDRFGRIENHRTSGGEYLTYSSLA